MRQRTIPQLLNFLDSEWKGMKKVQKAAAEYRKTKNKQTTNKKEA